MNKEKIEIAKEIFLREFPGGYEDEKMKEIGKKHRVGKVTEFIREELCEEAFDNPEKVMDNWVKVINKSSMVSLFEKPKFRDLVKDLDYDEKELLSNGLKDYLYGDQEAGFNMMVEILGKYKHAKWTILTAAGYYLKPTEEVFIKPTTTKMAINFFELEGVKYSPKATYEFYREYKKKFIELKEEVGLCEDNAAFGGFIMTAAG